MCVGVSVGVFVCVRVCGCGCVCVCVRDRVSLFVSTVSDLRIYAATS